MIWHGEDRGPGLVADEVLRRVRSLVGIWLHAGANDKNLGGVIRLGRRQREDVIGRARPIGKLLEHGALGRIPVVNSAIGVIAEQIDAFLVGGPCCERQPVCWGLDAGDRFALLDVEDGDLIAAKRPEQDVFAIGGCLKAMNVAHGRRKAPQFSAGGQVPENQRVVMAAGDGATLVREKGAGINELIVALEALENGEFTWFRLEGAGGSIANDGGGRCRRSVRLLRRRFRTGCRCGRGCWVVLWGASSGLNIRRGLTALALDVPAAKHEQNHACAGPEPPRHSLGLRHAGHWFLVHTGLQMRWWRPISGNICFGRCGGGDGGCGAEEGF
jgi:hypothetical protein